jgi:hypothetical protein
MKTNKIILTGLIVLVSAVFALSCDNPIGLGGMLDTNGPTVTIESPAPRAAKKSAFTLEGTARDKSGVDKLVIKAEKDTVEYPKQWRYLKGKWEVSNNYGKDGSWQPYSGPAWKGDTWTLPLDMGIDSKDDDGEYLFSVQAWDAGNFTDDNSFKTIMLIIDNYAPSVEVSNPYLYSRYIRWNGSQFAALPNYDFAADATELNGLHTNSTDTARFNSANIGKFLTQGFKLQWQIDDANDIWSIDIRFYEHNKPIDEEAATFPDDNYIFSYKKNLPPNVEGTGSGPNDLPGPNGSVTVPALHGAATGVVSVPDIYGGGTYQLKTPLTGKTTVQVVSICYDAAGWASEEKILGYFIYWEAAGEPWIEYTSEMEEPKPNYYYGKDIDLIKEEVFMIYPGKDMKALAFQAHGVGGVEYSIYKCGEDSNGKLTAPNKTTDGVEDMVGKEILNPRFSQIFSWSFAPPPMTGFYIVEAHAYGYKEVGDGKEIDYDNKSALYTALFRVQDLSFPKFEPIIPAASDPLFMHIYEKEGRSKIKIEGTVTDATRIENIYMVWINPQSKDYATMSQLEYYRDKDFVGWQQAAALDKDNQAHWETITDQTYDGSAPNKLWNIDPGESIGVTPNQRQIFEFSVEIDLEDDLHIGLPSTLDDLKSQMFLLRAENPDQKCDIITYAPQGDTIAPTIAIDTVKITKTNGDIEDCPSQHTIEQFANGDIITINGKWTENSTEYLDFDTYLKPNFEFLLNGVELTHDPDSDIEITYPPLPNGHATEGTFTITITLGTRINTGHLRDTLMINMKVHDFGGNPAETQASWLVKGDTLSFLRISSEESDDTYIAGTKIELYLEFSKPVLLNPNRGAGNDPVLVLNSDTGTGATAAYGRKDGTIQTVENTRQYFTYTVGTGHTTNALDVTGMQNANTGWDGDAYRYMWIHTPGGDNPTPEVVRLTTTTNGTPLPTGAANIRSLAAGKQISIDTTAPIISSVAATVGRHPQGAEVFVAVTFSENVTIDPDDLPYLTLNTGNSNTGTYPNRTIANANDISVTRNIIRFRYVVQSGDTTGTNVLTVTGSGGTITDIAGNAFVYSGGARNLANVYLDTLTPTNPQIQIVYGNNNAQVNNTVSGVVRNGTSSSAGGASWDPDTPHASRVDLVNVYNSDVKIQITPNGTVNTDYAKLEYSTNNGKDWVQITTPYRVSLSLNGSYNVTARQTDAAGNVSQWTVPISFTLDSGSLITRIDSSTPNGTYSNNTTTNSINVTVYFRKTLTFSGTNTQTITLNARRGTQDNFNNRTPITVTQNNVTRTDTTLLFSYPIQGTDNTPTGTGRTPYLDVTALSLQAADSDGVNVSALLTLPTDNSLLLGQRKDIIVTTGALAVSSGPTYNINAANDEAAGTISITFNRAISKGSGTITIAQSTTGYRLPAVLTEAQSARYRSIDNFNTYYTRGTNGFSNGAADTATKFVLNYAETTVVTPSNANNAAAIARMAYDFLQAETVTLPVTSQDVTVSGSTLTINLNGSNALQVLGASYTVTIPQNCVQDSLGYRWPTAAAGQAYTYTTQGINKSFVRVDKRTNRDSVARTTNNGSLTNPWLTANLDNVRQTTARLDCRTPNSVVRYNATEQRFDAKGANGTGTGSTNTTGTGGTGNPSRPSQTGTDAYWKNTETNANNISYLTQPANPQTNGTNYTNFTGTGTAAAGPHIQVGDNTEHGYVWRISTRSRNSATGNTYGDISEEIAFRTVLTVQLDGMVTNSLGAPPASGDQLWIRGGDAISSSSVPGFPLTWSDDFNSLNTEGKRAGIRLMTLKSVTTNFGTTSEWKWITWEVNVETFYDIVLGRDTATTVTPDAAKAWQYGPRAWAYQRGGWSVLKDRYSLYPGKHRWVRIHNGDFNPGGALNFSHTFQGRPDLATSITYTP